MKMICKTCGKVLPEGSKICPNCGSTLYSGYICPKCGGETLLNDSNQLECVKCGNIIPLDDLMNDFLESIKKMSDEELQEFSKMLDKIKDLKDGDDIYEVLASFMPPSTSKTYKA